MKLELPYDVICIINKFTGSSTAHSIPTYCPSKRNWIQYDRLLYKYRIYRMLCYDLELPFKSFYIFTQEFMEFMLDLNILQLRVISEMR